MNEAPATTEQRVLEVEHLTVRYSDATVFGRRSGYEAVHDVSFYVNYGEIVGLVGSPVCGFRPSLSPLSDTSKVPKPTS